MGVEFLKHINSRNNMYSMDYRELEEYTLKENEEFSNNPNYFLSRYKTLKKPITYATLGRGISVWPQVPMMGTVIVKLSPFTKEIFENIYKISTNQIPEVIQFVKDTGRLQFILTQDPIHYEKFEYLHPILEELHPPILNIPNLSEEQKKIYDFSVFYCNNLRRRGHFNKFFSIPFGLSVADHNNLFINEVKMYAFLRMSGFEQYADFYINTVNKDPSLASQILSIAHDLLAQPYIYPLQTVTSANFLALKKSNEEIRSLISSSKIDSVQFPYEVGSFLMKKITNFPTSLDTCKDMLKICDRNDLTDVFNAFTELISKNDIDAILANQSNLNEILDNIWEESQRIKTKASLAELLVSIGAVGLFYANLNGLILTLIAEILDKTSVKFNLIGKGSEELIKRFSSPQSVVIYDFTKKYNIK